jgi:hypothetical protein
MMRDLDNPRGCAAKQNAINPDSLGVSDDTPGLSGCARADSAVTVTVSS